MCKILGYSAKETSSAIVKNRHIKFIITSYTLSCSTRQSLSFDAHINGVEKEKVSRHLCAAAILNKIIFYIYLIVLSPEPRLCAKFQRNRSRETGSKLSCKIPLHTYIYIKSVQWPLTVTSRLVPFLIYCKQYEIANDGECDVTVNGRWTMYTYKQVKLINKAC